MKITAGATPLSIFTESWVSNKNVTEHFHDISVLIFKLLLTRPPK